MSQSPASPHHSLRGLGTTPLWTSAALGALLLSGVLLRAPGSRAAGPFGQSYTNQRVSTEPWSVHVVRVDRTSGVYELQAAHAGGRAVSLATLSEQVGQTMGRYAVPVAGINGDFYQRDRLFAGDPRGLQIVAGELLSAPSGGTAFWIDAARQPHIGKVEPRFEVTLPDGQRLPFGLNGERSAVAAQLYTPAVGESARAGVGREFVLEAPTNTAPGRWLPLQISTNYTARVREVRDRGGLPIQSGTLVLSVGQGRARSLPVIAPGALLQISTATIPSLAGALHAVGGGPALVGGGRRLRVAANNDDDYITSSMFERHPRSAVGWNDSQWIFALVDGRQRNSSGMTLDELGAYLVKLGCTDAMNLDGGGSATLWYDGRVRNNPCDGHERDIANALVIVRKIPAPAASPAAAGAGTGTGTGPRPGASPYGTEPDATSPLTVVSP